MKKTSIHETHIRSLEGFIDLIDEVDGYTAEHSRLVAEYAELIALKLGLDSKSVSTIRKAAKLHDVGKIRVPNDVLKKTGKYTPEDYEAMKTHTTHGHQLLLQIDYLKEAAPIVLHHHERWDGQGYPNKLKGEDIPIGSRIIAVCESYDTMTMVRPYKKNLTKEQALQELIHNKGTQFDPQVVDTFLEIINLKK